MTISFFRIYFFFVFIFFFPNQGPFEIEQGFPDGDYSLGHKKRYNKTNSIT